MFCVISSFPLVYNNVNNVNNRLNWSVFDWIISSVALFLSFGLLFLMDGLHVSNRSKYIAVFGFLTFMMYDNIMKFFYYQDVSYNIFDNNVFPYSKINFKDVYISSQANLILFGFKPIVTPLIGMLKKRICSCSGDGEMHSATDEQLQLPQQAQEAKKRLQTAYGLYKRPKLKWKSMDQHAYDPESNIAIQINGL